MTLFLVTTGLILALFYWFSIKPKNKADWSLDQAILPYSEFKGNLVKIHNIRNFHYSSEFNYIPRYYDSEFDLSKIKSIEYIQVPIVSWEGPAHTFLTFGFDDNKYVSISVEIRKRKNQKFSAVKGFFRRYTLMYVIANEKDVIFLRSLHRKNDLYIYPLKLNPEEMRTVFVDMLERANALKKSPEFYNTLFNACCTNLAKHLNLVSPKKISWGFRLVLPSYLDKYLHQIGIIDTSVPYDKLRTTYHANNKILKHAEHIDFSKKMRED